MFNRKQIAEKVNKTEDQLIIGFTSSSFDLGPHAGHCVMLMEAKSKCDFLIVALLHDPTEDRPEKNRPIQSLFERFIQASSSQYIDLVVPIESENDLENAILTIKPDIRFCGEEYRDTDHTGKGLCRVHYNARSHSFSSSDIRERIVNVHKLPQVILDEAKRQLEEVTKK